MQSIKIRTLLALLLFAPIGFGALIAFQHFSTNGVMTDVRMEQTDAAFLSGMESVQNLTDSMERSTESIATTGARFQALQEQYDRMKVDRDTREVDLKPKSQARAPKKRNKLRKAPPAKVEEPKEEQNKLQNDTKVARSLSFTPEVERYLVDNLKKTPDALSGGVWFQPKSYQKNLQRFGVYAARRDNKVSIRWGFNSAKRNYQNLPWYRLAIPKGLKPTAKVPVPIVWTAPYYPRENSLPQITVNSYMHNQKGHILGVSSIHWPLTRLDETIHKIKPTKNSKAFLVDGRENRIISYAEHSDISMTQTDTIPWMQKAHVQDAIAEKPTVISSVDINGVDSYVAFQRLPNGMIFGVTIPTEELNAGSQDTLVNALAVGGGLVLVFGIWAFLVLGMAFRPFKKVAQLVREQVAHTEGHAEIVCEPIEYKTLNEFQPLIGEVNAMMENVKERELKHGEKNADLRKKLVDKNTTLRTVEKSINALYDNINQAFLIMDAEGNLETRRSEITHTWFAGNPGKTFRAFLGKIDANAGFKFEEVWGQFQAGDISRKKLIKRLPKEARSDKGRYKLNYEASLNGDKVDKLLIFFTDISSEFDKERAEAESKAMSQIFRAVLQDKAGFTEFFRNAETALAQIQSDDVSPEERQEALHTLKTNAAVFGMRPISDLCHNLEEKAASQGDLFPGDAETLVELWTRTSSTLEEVLKDLDYDPIEIDEFEHRELVQLSQTGRPYEEITERLEGLKLESANRRLHRVAAQARFLAERNERKIEVNILGNHVRFHKETWAPFWQAFEHQVSNTVEHGTHDPEARMQEWKSEFNTITLATHLKEDKVILEISDDGPGFDWEKIRQEASDTGLPCETHQDLVDAICTRGADEDSKIGLGLVREAARKLGGELEIESQPEQGASIRFVFPVSALQEKEAVVIHRPQFQMYHDPVPTMQ